ncbi:MAG: hypothetical protein R3208_13410 [Ketobacteraceae bacterium]|nr:hypothetical protein [Ketobacteraceae bacterium]
MPPGNKDALADGGKVMFIYHPQHISITPITKWRLRASDSLFGEFYER